LIYYKLKKYDKIKDLGYQEDDVDKNAWNSVYQKAKIDLHYAKDIDTVNTILQRSCQSLADQTDKLHFLTRLKNEIPHSHAGVSHFLAGQNLIKVEQEISPFVAEIEQYKPVQSREIDIVFTWADSGEEMFSHKFNEINGFEVSQNDDNQKNNLRYLANGEIQFSLLCIQKIFPTVRNIFIVTNNQIFNINFLDNTFQKKIKFINQKEIILESYVKKQVFNSTIVESFLWNIPDLSDCFLYFCDDYFLGKALVPDRDIFNENGVPYSSMHRTNFDRLKFIEHLSETQKLKKIYPESFLYNAIKEFQRVYQLTPDLMHNHQAMILSRAACEKAFYIFSEHWKLNFFNDLVRSNNSIHTLLLYNWVSLYHKYQVLDQSKTNDYITFHNGFNESNRKYLLDIRFQYFCINDLSDTNSREEFAKFQEEYLDYKN